MTKSKAAKVVRKVSDKTAKIRSKKAETVLGFSLLSHLERKDQKKKQGVQGQAMFVGAQAAHRVAQLIPDLPAWLIERALRKRGEPQLWTRLDGPFWLLIPQVTRTGYQNQSSCIEGSAYSAARDVTGLMFAGVFSDLSLHQLDVHFVEAQEEEILGALTGVEIGLYRYKQSRSENYVPLQINPHGVPAAILKEAGNLGVSVNLARHFVNLPASELNPSSFCDLAQLIFAGSKTSSVEIWSGERLEKERMGLLKAVGQAATETSRLLHVRYRPDGKKRFSRPLAFVGKGVTFDTGGLDMKDSGSMRLMKKDMGGAASVLGLAFWVEQSGLDIACDFYLALAENAVSERSIHPGDVVTSRAGHKVEIDNTDAEGRLVMADALDVAITAKGSDQPLAIIDLSTLTGAMRVALGTRIAGFFATHDALADAVNHAAQAMGEPVWRMPLFQEYWSSLRSYTGDFANSSNSRFGGAITAALFLQRFVGKLPWLHFDLYAWTEGLTGACMEPGGNGQAIQLLARFLKNLPSDFFAKETA